MPRTSQCRVLRNVGAAVSGSWSRPSPSRPSTAPPFGCRRLQKSIALMRPIVIGYDCTWEGRMRYLRHSSVGGAIAATVLAAAVSSSLSACASKSPAAGLANQGLVSNPTARALSRSGQLAPDVRRVADLIILGLAEEKFYRTRGKYSGSLALLFPTFAPLEGGRRLTSAPADPATGRPYRYQTHLNGHAFNLEAHMSSGRLFAIHGLDGG